MRARLLWVLTIALLAVALPESAVAAPDDFGFTVLKDVCHSSGGDFGHGHLVLKVRVAENGPSGANRFTLDAQVKHRKHNGAPRQTEYAWDRFAATFPDDENSYYHTRFFSYDPNDHGQHRIVVVIRVWHGRQMLASRTINGTPC